MANDVLTFDDSIKEEILDTFDKSINDEGLIVEKRNPGQKVLDENGVGDSSFSMFDF